MILVTTKEVAGESDISQVRVDASSTLNGGPNPPLANSNITSSTRLVAEHNPRNQKRAPGTRGDEDPCRIRDNPCLPPLLHVSHVLALPHCTLGLNVEGSITPVRSAGNLHVLYDILHALSHTLLFLLSSPSLLLSVRFFTGILEEARDGPHG